MAWYCFSIKWRSCSRRKRRDSRGTFLSALYGAVNEVPCRVIATIRSDFLHYCHEHDDLLKVLRGAGHYPFGRVEKLHAARHHRETRAQCAGLTISDGPHCAG